MAVEPGAAHSRKVNGILGLLCRELFPGLVTIGGREEPAYTFDHYVAAPDAEDREGRRFANKAERVKAELWVSICCTTLLNTSHSLNNLQIMTGYIVYICRTFTDAPREKRRGPLLWHIPPV